jgi:hypothetical protein
MRHSEREGLVIRLNRKSQKIIFAVIAAVIILTMILSLIPTLGR